MLRSILFVLALLAQTTVVQSCDVCGAAGFVPTLNPQIWVGAQYWYCDEFVSRANEFDSTTCAIVQSYAIAQCGCQDTNRNPPPPAPVYLPTMCNICGGANGSNLHNINPSLANFNVGVSALGVTATCGFFYETALAGAFTDYYSCTAVQESLRSICECGGPGW